MTRRGRVDDTRGIWRRDKRGSGKRGGMYIGEVGRSEWSQEWEDSDQGELGSITRSVQRARMVLVPRPTLELWCSRMFLIHHTSHPCRAVCCYSYHLPASVQQAPKRNDL